MILSKFAKPDWRPGMDPKGHAESPAQHRYPVWWTGDGVNLQASVESMVNTGIFDFKPYVHSDCGGDHRGSAGNLLRWTAHCAFGTIFRYHGSDHRPWTYGAAVEGTVRRYLKMRYALMPSLVAAGQAVTQAAFPLVARCDLFWPTMGGAASSHQYLFLNDTLVAPIFETLTNVTSVPVWVPPGTWEDAWSGARVSGPKNITATQPYERQPMWHRVGALVVGARARYAPCAKGNVKCLSFRSVSVRPAFMASSHVACFPLLTCLSAHLRTSCSKLINRFQLTRLTMAPCSSFDPVPYTSSPSSHLTCRSSSSRS